MSIMRRLLLVPGALLLVLALGYAALWLYAADRLEDGFVAWSKRQAFRGHEIGHGPLALSGFPGPIRLAIAAPRYTAAETGLAWSAERAVLEMRPWDWWTYRLDLFGRQSLTLPVETGAQEILADAASAYVIAEVDGHGKIRRTALYVDGLALGDAGGDALLSADRVRAGARVQAGGDVPPGEAALDVWLEAGPVTLGPPVQSPLGARIEQVGITASVKGDLPDTLLRNSVEMWRRDGGTVELAQFHIAWGALDLRANGTMALDELMRPLGAVSAEIRGYGETLTALERARMVPPKAAAGSRLALDLLSRQDGADGRRVVTIPVSAQNGALYLGPVRLARLEPIPFPVR